MSNEITECQSKDNLDYTAKLLTNNFTWEMTVSYEFQKVLYPGSKKIVAESYAYMFSHI